jgi:hypothetical protein
MYDVQPADEPGWTSPPFAAGLDGRPELILGCKGLLTLELSVAGFHPRCPEAVERCPVEDQVLRPVRGGPADHQAACVHA